MFSTRLVMGETVLRTLSLVTGAAGPKVGVGVAAVLQASEPREKGNQDQGYTSKHLTLSVLSGVNSAAVSTNSGDGEVVQIRLKAELPAQNIPEFVKVMRTQVVDPVADLTH
jgi:hypothetical protein